MQVQEQPRQTIAALAAHTLASRLVIFGSGAVAAVLIARSLGPDGRGLYYLPVTMAGSAAALGALFHICELRMAGQLDRDEAVESAHAFVHAGLVALALV